MPGRLQLASLLLASVLVAGAETAAQTEEPAGRGYQRDSVESLSGRATRAAAWVKNQLSGFHVTPAKLLSGLGLLGVLLTWNKNKRKPAWAMLAVLSWLLLFGGAAAMLLRWNVLA